MTVARKLLAGTVGAAALLSLAGCGNGSPPAKSASDTHKVVPAATTTVPQVTGSTIVINGKSVAVPTEGGSKPIGQSDDTGQQIILSSDGALPAQLFAATSTPVVWTNLTDKTVTLTINNVGLPPQTIASGASYSWTPHVLAFSFAASNGGKGLVNVGAFTQ